MNRRQRILRSICRRPSLKCDRRIRGHFVEVIFSSGFVQAVNEPKWLHQPTFRFVPIEGFGATTA